MNEISVHIMFTLLKHYVNLALMLQNGRLELRLGLDSNFIKRLEYICWNYIYLLGMGMCVCRRTLGLCFLKFTKVNLFNAKIVAILYFEKIVYKNVF